MLAISNPCAIRVAVILLAGLVGLGIELNPNVVKSHLAEGERWWG
jgi:hypothetical protein